MNKVIIYIFIIAVFIITIPVLAENEQIILSKSTQVNSNTDNLPYILTADGEISYDYEQQTFLAVDNGRFAIDDIILSADKIAVFYGEDLVKAEGSPLTIKVGEQTYQGSSLEFNYRTRRGSISSVYSKINDLSVKGEEIILSKGNELEINEVELTPCILEEPHYSLKAEKLQVYPEDKIVARGVWLYFKGYKVFYLPVYIIEFDDSSGKYDNISFIPNIGYNSTDGFYLDFLYSYQLFEKMQGTISSELNQYGEKYLRVDNQYKLSSDYIILSSYNYQQEEVGENQIKITNELSTGLQYKDNAIMIYPRYIRDYTTDNNIVELDTSYENSNYQIDTFNRVVEGKLKREHYNITYSSRYPVSLQYKKGYDIDYLPYLSIESPDSQYAGVNIASSIGLGRVANKDIHSDKVNLNLYLDKDFNVNNNLNLKFYGKLDSNYYYNDRRQLNQMKDYYNHYLLGIKTEAKTDINKDISLDYALDYQYRWDDGDAYLPEDREELDETIEADIALGYRLPELSSIRFNIESNYSLTNSEFKELNLKLSRQYDCFSYYLGYDLMDETYEIGINI